MRFMNEVVDHVTVFEFDDSISGPNGSVSF